MAFKKIIIICFFICGGFILFCDQSWIIPLDSFIYRRAEELFICEGYVPVFEELPMIADELKSALSELAADCQQPETAEQAEALNAEIMLPMPVISPLVELGFSAGLNSETGRKHTIPTSVYDHSLIPPAYVGQDKSMLDFEYMYEINKLPSIIKAGLTVEAGGFSLLIEPEIRETTTALLADDNITNIPGDFISIDYYSLPFRGITTFYSSPVEFRLGRDKLSLGPSKWGGLTLNKHVPYYDYIKARFFVPGFSLSCYVINLNPIMTSKESDYLNTLSEDEYKKLEPNGPKNGDPYMGRYKNLVLSKATFTPWSWFCISVTQNNLVGGRPLEISDFNPLLVFHNNFDEGTYSVPVSLTATVVPLKGLKAYGEFYFYDAALGDESKANVNPLAIGYQLGFTLLSDPFFKLGPGRFRLDAEFSYIDPWTYGKAYDLRKFTTRFVYVESFVGRNWVDYPLGFYLGPDVIDIHASLSYGIPGDWEAELHWNTTAKGKVDLYGWGNDNDYYHIGETGYPLGFAPTGTVEWTHTFTLSGYWAAFKGITFKAWYTLKFVKNRYNNADQGTIFNYVAFSVLWKIF
jgi:hypothetical protein